MFLPRFVKDATPKTEHNYVPILHTFW